MFKYPIGAVLLLCSVSYPAHALNKCTSAEGKTTYTDQPCKGGTEKTEIRPDAGSAKDGGTVGGGCGLIPAPIPRDSDDYKQLCTAIERCDSGDRSNCPVYCALYLRANPIERTKFKSVLHAVLQACLTKNKLRYGATWFEFFNATSKLDSTPGGETITIECRYNEFALAEFRCLAKESQCSNVHSYEEKAFSSLSNKKYSSLNAAASDFCRLMQENYP